MNVKTGTAGDVYENSTSDNDPTLNKSEKWNALISNRDYMDCSSSGREKRAFEILNFAIMQVLQAVLKTEIKRMRLCI